jgi:hypothetical protein
VGRMDPRASNRAFRSPLLVRGCLGCRGRVRSSAIIAAHGWYRQATGALRTALESIAIAAGYAVRKDEGGLARWRAGAVERNFGEGIQFHAAGSQGVEHLFLRRLPAPENHRLGLVFSRPVEEQPPSHPPARRLDTQPDQRNLHWWEEPPDDAAVPSVAEPDNERGVVEDKLRQWNGRVRDTPEPPRAGMEYMFTTQRDTHPADEPFLATTPTLETTMSPIGPKPTSLEAVPIRRWTAGTCPNTGKVGAARRF